MNSRKREVVMMAKAMGIKREDPLVRARANLKHLTSLITGQVKYGVELDKRKIKNILKYINSLGRLSAILPDKSERELGNMEKALRNAVRAYSEGGDKHISFLEIAEKAGHRALRFM